MTIFENRVEVWFDAGHRILGHKGKCSSPHGHTFRAEVFYGGTELDALGFVADFGEVKAAVKGWIDEHWDHGFLLNDGDKVLVEAFKGDPEAKVYLLCGSNPSAEVMARELFEVVRSPLGPMVCRIRIWESPSHHAEYGP
jgi:6-pyruvoyltetrahydropterin/6-carboxytetrahydropterin synthase